MTAVRPGLAASFLSERIPCSDRKPYSLIRLSVECSPQALQTKDSTTGRLSVPLLNGRFMIAVMAVSPYN